MVDSSCIVFVKSYSPGSDTILSGRFRSPITSSLYAVFNHTRISWFRDGNWSQFI